MSEDSKATAESPLAVNPCAYCGYMTSFRNKRDEACCVSCFRQRMNLPPDPWGELSDTGRTG